MDLSKMVLIYLCIAISCLFYDPTLVLGPSPQAETVLNLFNMNNTNYQSLNTINTSSGATWNQPPANQGVTIVLTIIDGLWTVLGFIWLIFRALFSPVIIMATVGFPWQITYLIGLPLTVLFIISIIREIRGY